MDFGQNLDSKSYDKVCMYVSIQVCKYVSMQVCKYASMQVCKYASIHIYASMLVCKYAHICKGFQKIPYPNLTYFTLLTLLIKAK